MPQNIIICLTMFSFILLIPADLPVLLDFIYGFYFSEKTTLIGTSKLHV